mgnify:CR=1 FL=1
MCVFQAEDGIRDRDVTGVQTCALPISLIINYDITGTAINGVDFPLLPNPVTFLPGQDTITLVIDPTFDGIPDNWEYVTITTTTITVCGDTIISSGTLYILDSVQIDINEPDPLELCQNDSVQDRKSTRLNSSHITISYAVFCLKKKNNMGDHNSKSKTNCRVDRKHTNSND